MRKRMLPKLKDQLIYVWPPVRSLFPNGRILLRNFLWRVVDPTTRGVRLECIVTGHFIWVASACIRNYAEEIPGPYKFLKLRRRLWITAREAQLKPHEWRPTWQHALSRDLN
jgi:hypothetical protein